MDRTVYTDLSIITAKYFMKYSGVWFTMNNTEKLQRLIALLCVLCSEMYCVYANVVNICHYWGNNTSNILYAMNNILIVFLATAKVIIVRTRALELERVVRYAEHNFWHYNYEGEEKLIFAQCQKYCKLWIIFVLIVTPGSVSGYVVAPIFNNIIRNKTYREFPLEIWTDLPATETPYFELIFTFQGLCILTVGITYICPDTFLCLLCIHVIFQFRMLQHKLSNCLITEEKDAIRYLEHCTETMRVCVKQHQALIFFCEMIENVFTLTILCHMVVFSLLVGLSGYQILLPETTIGRRIIFVFHVIGSFVHLIIFTFCCDGLVSESSNICNSIYFGSWNTLPMDKLARVLRLNMRFMMLRSMKPCCLTAGGFFPVSLATATSLLSSTFSYLTLMRERFLRNDSQ